MACTISPLEHTLARQIRWAHLPTPQREYRAVAGRRFRWDFAWPEHHLLAEVQGGTWGVRGKGGKSAHSGGVAAARDAEKRNLAAIEGWYTMDFTVDQIRAGSALVWLQTYFKVHSLNTEVCDAKA